MKQGPASWAQEACCLGVEFAESGLICLEYYAGATNAPFRIQAAVYWQIDSYHEKAARDGGKDVVRINMDETAIALVQKPTKGILMSQTWRRSRRRPRLRASLGQQRTNLTYAAFVCDDVTLQPMLPQFVIGSKRALPLRVYRALFHDTPANVFLLRGDSAWNTHELMVEMINVVAAVCRRAKPNAEVLFCMDMAFAHLHVNVFRALQRHGFRVELVPAKTTWLLQPLDAWVFRTFKDYLRRRFHDTASAHGEFAVSVAWLLPILYDAIQTVISGRDWRHAFVRVGLGQGPAGMSRELLRQLEVTEVPVASNQRPADRDLLPILPASRVLTMDLLEPVSPALAALPAGASSNVLRIRRPGVRSTVARWMLPMATRLPGGSQRSQSQHVHECHAPLTSSHGPAEASWLPQMSASTGRAQPSGMPSATSQTAAATAAAAATSRASAAVPATRATSSSPSARPSSSCSRAAA